MTFRARLKKTLSRHFHTSSGSEDSNSSGAKGNCNTYRPGEKTPTPRYKRPVAKEHKELLDSFSFANAWRRKSAGSLYSPMGSRMPSRKNSVEAQVNRQSNSSVQPVLEGEADDTDVGNVGLFQQRIADQPASLPAQEPYPQPLAAVDCAPPDTQTRPSSGTS